MAPCFVKPAVAPHEVNGYDYTRDEGGYVLVSVTRLFGPDEALDKKSELWRVSIWGADDTGYEQDVPTMAEAVKIYDSIVWVYGLPEGFRYA